MLLEVLQAKWALFLKKMRPCPRKDLEIGMRKEWLFRLSYLGPVIITFKISCGGGISV